MTSENTGKSKPTNGTGLHAATADPWEQSQPYQHDGREALTSSKFTKNEAEYARQTIANEILEAAKTVCGELIADTERTLEKARYLETEADRKHVEAHEERERAAAIRLEAEEYREALIEDAKRQSLEQIERARSSAERECAEMKSRASIETEKMLAHAQVMRAAAMEELEAQKIYAEAARFQAASQETLTQARNRLNHTRTSDQLKPGSNIKEPSPTPVSTPTPAPAKSNITDPGNDPSGHQGQIDRATAIAMGTVAIESKPEPIDSAALVMNSLEELRNMQEAASKAVDAAVAEEKRPDSLKKNTRSKRATKKI